MAAVLINQADDTEEYEPRDFGSQSRSEDSEFVRGNTTRHEQRGKIRTKHSELWKDSVRKRRRNMVSCIMI